MVGVFNLGYFIWILVGVLLFISVHYLLVNKSDKIKFWTLFGLSLFIWFVHFSRIWLEKDLYTYQLFFVDFCGFNTMLLPFLFISKSQRARDFMFFCGAFFAAHSFFYPNNIFGDPYLEYNTIRFFITHFLLVAIPLWLISLKMYTPSWKNVHWASIYLLVGALYNISLSAIFVETGLVRSYINYMGLWGGRDDVYQYAEIIAPFFRYETVVDGITVTKPIPFLYMLPTLYFVYVPIWYLIALLFKKNSLSETT